jgi:hypothetical protein
MPVASRWTRREPLVWILAASLSLMIAALAIDGLRPRRSPAVGPAPESRSTVPLPTPDTATVKRPPAPARVVRAAGTSSAPATETPRAPPPPVRRAMVSSRAEFDRMGTRELDNAWSREEGDPEWSANARAFMEVFLQTAAVDPAALLDADCRASVCRLKVDLSTPDALQRVGKTMNESARGFRSTWQAHQDGGPRVAVIYAPREELPAN